MKRSMLLTLAVLSFSLNALGSPLTSPMHLWPFEDDAALDSRSDDYFAKIEALFNEREATVPTREELSGWWTGRCFHHQEKSKPLGGLLVGQDLGSELGPLFPATKSGRVFLLVHRTNAAAFDLTSRESEADAKKWIEENGHRVGRSAVRNRSLASTYFSVNGTPADWQVRRVVKDGKVYFVLLAAQLIETSALKEGDSIYACYFFDKAKLESKP